MKQGSRGMAQAVVLLFLAATILTGCGLMDTFNPPFKDKLNIDKVEPIPKLDESVADPAIFSHVSVLNENGKPENLNPGDKPILFVAYWCPHCQRTLLQFSKHLTPSEMPVIVSLGFVPGTSLDFAKKVTHEEFSHLGISQTNLTVDYGLARSGNDYVKKGYPTLAFVHQGKVMTLVGEHTWPVWSHVLPNPVQPT